MKNRKLFLLPVILLALSACTSRSSKPSESKPGESTPPVSESSETPTSVEPGESTEPSTPSEPSQPEEPSQPVEPSQPARDPLAAPVLRLNAEKTGLTWDAVADAVSYDIVVNDGDAQNVQTPGYTFNSEVGTYAVKVKARADVATYDSAFSAVFNYETKLTAVGALSLNDDGDKIQMASLVGLGAEMKLNTGDYADATVAELSIAITAGGLYTIHAKAGYDEDNNINYAANPDQNLATKSILVVLPAAAPKVLLDGSDADATKYVKTVYKKVEDKWGWYDTTASAVTLDSNYNAGITEGKCVNFKYFRNSLAFRFQETGVHFDGTYNTLSLDLYSDGQATIIMQFVITDENVVLNGHSLKNVYMQLEFPTMPQGWIHCDIPVEDEDSWKVFFAGSGYKFSELAPVIEAAESTANPYGANTKINKMADFLPFVGEVDIILKKAGDSQESHVYMDNLEFNNSGKSNAQPIVPIQLRDSYYFKATGTKGQLIKTGENAGKLNIFVTKDNTVEVPVSFQILPSNVLLLTSTATGYEFTMILMSFDGGMTFSAYAIETEDETTKAALQNFAAYTGQVIDTFDYDAQGQGYDQAHTIDQVEPGLRTAYFADYMTSGSSPIGGGKWSLMASTDYLLLDKDTGHTEAGSAKIKVSGSFWMRYITAGLVDGTASASPWEKANTFSIWIKNDNNADATIKVRVYFVSQVTSSNADIDSARTFKQITVKANTGWTEYKVPIDPRKTYYGFSLAIQNNSSIGGKWLQIDDVSVYNTYSIMDIFPTA